jgi:hypothetical protein
MMTMRLVLILASLLLLTRCGTLSPYDASRGSVTSQTGGDGGAGVQAPLWSSDPGQKTILNQKAGSNGQ